MKRLIHFNSFVIVLLSFSLQLQAQFKNKNEYIKLNDELFCQYSPIEKGWAIFKFDNKTQTYIKQEYAESPDIKKSYFENIYVVGDRFYTYTGKAFKSISGFSNKIYSSEYKELLIFNSPQTDKIYPHTVAKEMDNKYVSLHDRPMSCDTFALQNGTFIPIFKKDNPVINENIFTSNGLIVPVLYGVSSIYYSIRKSSQGYILTNRIFSTQMGYLIQSQPDMAVGLNQKNPELTKQFNPEIQLSYYNDKSFLISEKNKWYICKVPANETDFNAYLNDKKRILPKNETFYSYFGNLEANSIKVLTWNSGKPEYFVANINGIDYLYDYRKAVIKNINKNITFPIVENISGDYIRAYYPPDVYRDFKPMYLEVKQGNNLNFYNYVNNKFKKLDKNPFVGYYKATFIGSTYKEFDNSGRILSEKTFKPSMTKGEIAAEIKRQAEEEEFARKEKLRIQSEGLKSAIMDSKLKYDKYNNYYFMNNRFFYNFPMKYYNGSQPFFNCTESDYLSLCTVENGSIKTINNCKEYLSDTYRGFSSSSDVYAVGASQRTERYPFYSPWTLANINTGYFQQVGYGNSSYNDKFYLITKTFKLLNSSSSYESSKLISFNELFVENPDIKDINSFKIIYASRLSNNNILVIFRAEIRYLSNQMNSMFGIDGMNKISRTFDSQNYYKFVVISEDGTKLVSNRNYLLPIKLIRPVDNGFVILSEKLGDVISLSINDFGRKSNVYSQAAGKNIIVTEGVDFSNRVTYNRGIKLFKFNNNAELVKEITVDNPNDKEIANPYPIYIQDSENYLCLLYCSFEQAVVNEPVYVFKLFDFNLDLKSTVVDEKPQLFGINTLAILKKGGLPDDKGFITSLNDTFFVYRYKSDKTVIPFKF
ncbi:hypothetical protein DSECCO2_141020 [anaerobic digester metagenome]